VANDDNGHSSSGGGWTPRPDPTLLTTQQLIREQAGLKELVLSIVDGKFQVIDTRLAGMDKAMGLVQVQQNGWQDVINASVANLRVLHDEKFNGAIEVVNEKITSLANVTTQQFKNIDDKFAEKDKAVSVGLSAQKESAAAQQDSNNTATRKMEDNFTKLLDQGREIVAEIRRNTETQITDIKSRLDKGEGKSEVSDPAIADALKLMTATLSSLQLSGRDSAGQQKGQKDSMALMLIVAGIGGGIIAALIEVALRVH
jgi:hypothetical protein